MMSCPPLPSFINWACQLFSVPHMNFLFVIIIILSRQGTDSNAAEMVQGRMQSDAIGDHEHRPAPARRIPSEMVVVFGDDERDTTSVDDVDSRAEAFIAYQRKVWLAENRRTVQRRYTTVWVLIPLKGWAYSNCWICFHACNSENNYCKEELLLYNRVRGKI